MRRTIVMEWFVDDWTLQSAARGPFRVRALSARRVLGAKRAVRATVRLRVGHRGTRVQGWTL